MKKQLKVCHVTTVHPADDIRIFHKECCSLARSGKYEIVLLATNCQTQTLNGVSIKGITCRYSSRLERSLKLPWALYQEAKWLDADVYHFHDPDFLPYARQLMKRGKKVIYDVHEDVPLDILSKHWLPRGSRRILATMFEQFENQISKKLTSIITSTPAIKKRFGALNSRTVDIMNFPMIDEFRPISWRERRNEVCYTGTIAKINGIAPLIESLNYVSNIRLNLAGWYSPPSYRTTLSQQEGWRYVNELGRLGRKEVVDAIQRSKAGIVTIFPEDRFVKALATKMFEYMAAGIAVIASDFPLWKEIIEKHQCGLCVNPQDSKAIAEAITYLTSNENVSIQMGINGRKAIENDYNWTKEFGKLAALYDSI